MPSQIQIQCVIDNLMCTPFASGHWNAFANSFGEMFNGSVVIGMNRHFEHDLNIIALGNIDPFAVSDYYAKSRYYNCWTHSWFDNAAAGALTRKIDNMDDNEFELTEYYNIFLRPNNWYWALLCKIEKGEHFSLDAIIVRSKKYGIFNALEMESFKTFMPEIKNSVKIRRLINLSRVDDVFMKNSSVGLMLVQEDGNIKFFNPEALRIIVKGDGINAWQNTILCKDDRDNERLLMLIKQAISVARGRTVWPPLGGFMRINRVQGEPLVVRIWPMPEMQDAFGALNVGPCALMFVGDAERMRSTGALYRYGEAPSWQGRTR